MALPEQALDGSAEPQSVVEGRAPRWQVMWRISLGRRPSERRWIRERMSVRRSDVMVDSELMNIMVGQSYYLLSSWL